MELLPCVDCIKLPICMSKITNCGKGIEVLDILAGCNRGCEILREYLRIADDSLDDIFFERMDEFFDFLDNPYNFYADV